MNRMPSTAIELPTSTKTIINEIKFKFFIKCKECDESLEENTKCKCDRLMEKDSKKNNFIVHINLESQILNRYFSEIIDYLNREKDDSLISDIDDGS